MIKRVLSFIFASALLGGVANAELLTPASTVPEEGMVTNVGSFVFHFSTTPEVNMECTEPATLAGPNGMVYAVYAGENGVDIPTEEGSTDGDARLLFDRNGIKDAGDYTLTVPEGLFKFANGDLSVAMTKNYKIMGRGTAVIEPTSGYPAEIPTTVTVTFPGYAKIIDNVVAPSSEDTEAIWLYYPANNVLCRDGGNYLSIKDNVLTFNLSSINRTDKGEYKIIIYPGALTLETESGEQVLNGRVEVIYYLPKIPVPVLDPAPGDVYEIDRVKVTLQDNMYFGQYMRFPSLYTVIDDATKGDRVAAFGIYNSTIRGEHSLEFGLATPYTTVGSYYFAMGKSGFSVYTVDEDGTKSEDVWNNCDYLLKYNIIPAPSEPETGLNNPQETTAIEAMEVTFPGAMTLEKNPSFTGKVGLYDKFFREVKGHTVSYDLVEAADQNSGYKVVVTVEPKFTDLGTYSLWIPTGAFLCNGDVESREVMQNFTVMESTGADIIDAEEALTDVYTIDGVLVLKNVSAEAVKELPAGLYIAGGKKILVK